MCACHFQKTAYQTTPVLVYTAGVVLIPLDTESEFAANAAETMKHSQK